MKIEEQCVILESSEAGGCQKYRWLHPLLPCEQKTNVDISAFSCYYQKTVYSIVKRNHLQQELSLSLSLFEVLILCE